MTNDNSSQYTLLMLLSIITNGIGEPTSFDHINRGRHLTIHIPLTNCFFYCTLMTINRLITKFLQLNGDVKANKQADQAFNTNANDV